MEMLAAQAAHREGDSLGADEESIATNEKLSEVEKKRTLQKALNMAASNGDVERVRKLVQGLANEYIDVNLPDEEGTVPLIYASCFVGYNYSCCLRKEATRRGRANWACVRDIMMWLLLLLTRAPGSISRIATSGVRSCGR